MYMYISIYNLFCVRESAEGKAGPAEVAEQFLSVQLELYPAAGRWYKFLQQLKDSLLFMDKFALRQGRLFLNVAKLRYINIQIG